MRPPQAGEVAGLDEGGAAAPRWGGGGAVSASCPRGGAHCCGGAHVFGWDLRGGVCAVRGAPAGTGRFSARGAALDRCGSVMLGFVSKVLTDVPSLQWSVVGVVLLPSVGVTPPGVVLLALLGVGPPAIARLPLPCGGTLFPVRLLGLVGVLAFFTTAAISVFCPWFSLCCLAAGPGVGVSLVSSPSSGVTVTEGARVAGEYIVGSVFASPGVVY